MQKNKLLHIVFTAVTGVCTLTITGIMNISFIPAIEKAAGMRCFDMCFGYSFEYSKSFISVLSETAMNTYLHKQLPLDFVYPLCYCAFFILLMLLFTKKHRIVSFVPAVLAIADYTENICIRKMLTADVLSSSLTGFSSAATIVKTILMYLCFIIIIALIVKYFADKKKPKANQ